MFRHLLATILAAGLCSIASAQALTRTATYYGSACGPALTATIKQNGNTHKVSLHVKGAKANSKLIMMIAVEKINLPLSWFFLKTKTSCRLLLVPIFIQQHQPDSSGNLTYGRGVPTDWVGTGHAQFLEFQADGTVLATNGATITSK